MKITHQPWSQLWLNPIFMQVKDSAWFLTRASPSKTESCCSACKQTRKTNQLEESAWSWLDALWWCWWFMHGVCSLWETESTLRLCQHCHFLYGQTDRWAEVFRELRRITKYLTFPQNTNWLEAAASHIELSKETSLCKHASAEDGVNLYF